MYIYMYALFILYNRGWISWKIMGFKRDSDIIFYYSILTLVLEVSQKSVSKISIYSLYQSESLKL